MSESKVAPIAAKLRASVLQRAIQGKLVPQDPDDEPASELVERICKERAELVKEKKAKKPKRGESVIWQDDSGSWWERVGKDEVEHIDNALPFDIPNNWVWSRLKTVAIFSGGGTPDKGTPSYWNGVIPWASMKDIHGNVLTKTIDTITESGLRSKPSISIASPGELIVSTRLNPGKPIISGIRTAINQDLKLVQAFELNVPYLQNWFKANAAYFKALGSGTTVPGIKIEHLEESLIPLPPLAEQQRIVKRINAIMPLIDRLEKLERESDAVDSRFWRDLPSSILQQAVEGKLVPQDPDDEPSSVLLERIREERTELVKQKKAKAPRGGESRIYRGTDGSWYEQRGKAKPVCIDKEIPFDIPENWEWSRLENITEYIQRGKSPKYSTIEKYPVVAQKCNQWSGFSLAKAKFIDPSTLSQYGIERFLVTGDLLWNSTGLGTLGRIAIYDDTVNPYECAVADSHVTVIRTDMRWMNYSFLFAYFAGPSVQRVIESQASGSTKQKELSLTTVQNYLVPVPPLAEQRRIVAKVSEIRAMLAKRFVASVA